MNKKNKTSKLGTKPGETRATFIVNEDQLEKVKAISYYDRISIKDVLSKALDDLFIKRKSDLLKARKAYKNRNNNLQSNEMIIESFINAVKDGNKEILEEALQYFKDKIDTINEQK